MKRKLRIYTAVVASGIAIIGTVLATSGKHFSLFPNNTVFADNSYTIKLTDSKNDYQGSGSQTVLTETGGKVSFSFTNCDAISGHFAKIRSGGVIGNDEQITSVSSFTPVFSAASGASLQFRASFDKSNWGEYTTLTTNKSFELPSNPYYLQFKALNGEITLTSLTIRFSCIENPAVKPVSKKVFTKQTTIDSEVDCSGEYLIVCESNNVCLNGSLNGDTIDSANNNASVTINDDDTITWSEALAAKTVIIESYGVDDHNKQKYTIQSKSGYYLYNTSNANALKSTNTLSTAQAYPTTIWTDDGDTAICSCETHLRFNAGTNDMRFRYYKSSSYTNQKEVYLYKLSDGQGDIGKPSYECGIKHTDNKSTYTVQEKFADFVDGDGLNVQIIMSDQTECVVKKDLYSYKLTFNNQEVSPNVTFAHPGTYRVTIEYKSLLPVSYDINVLNVTTSITASKTKTSYKVGETIDLTDISAVKNYHVDGSSSSISFANFANNDLGCTLKNPNGSVVSSGTFNIAGNWTARVYLLSNSSIYKDITIAVSTVPVSSVSLNKTSLNLNVGDKETLTASILPSDATIKTVTWSSDDPLIASVNNGEITANSIGTTTIKATADGKTATCSVTVSAVSVTSISLSPTTKTIYVGQSFTLSATISPSNATNKNVTWTSSNNNVATVTSNGEVSGKANGTATITVKTEDGNKTATCSVSVEKVAVTSVTLSESSLSLYVNGENKTVTATVQPDNATDHIVTWTIDKSGVASITPNNNSVTVTPVSAGTATLTASVGGKSATCSISVSASAPEWKLVTSTNDLVVGNKYVIAQNAKGTTAGDITSQYMSNISSTFNSDKTKITTLGSGTIELTLGGNSGAWTFANSSGSLLTATAVKKLAWGGSSGTNTWTISIDGSKNATISSTNSSYGRFLYNANSGQERFTPYATSTGTSNTMLLPQLYTLTGGSVPSDVKVTEITVNPSSASLNVGGTTNLTATVLPNNATNKEITWSSSNNSVATVTASGAVTAQGNGTCTITATAKDGSGVTGTCSITVSPSIVLTGITLDNVKTTYQVGESFEKPTVIAQYSSGPDKDVTSSATFNGFSSSSAGTCTITVSYTENSVTKSTTYQVTIKSSGGDEPVGDNYQITFKENDSDKTAAMNSLAELQDEITAGADYITNLNTINYVYAGSSGLKMGKSGNGGTLDVTLSSTISNNICNCITISVAQYGTKTCTTSVYINGGSTSIGSISEGDGTKMLTLANNTKVSSIKLKGTERVYLKGITFNCKPVTPVNPTAISLTPNSLNLGIGEISNKLTVNYTPTTANQNLGVTWSSNNTSVATVSDGVITAKAKGTATITATGYNGITATCSVTVSEVAVTSVSLSDTSATLSIGDTKQLTATVLPTNATNKNVNWSSSKESVASVTSNGYVTAKAVGSAVITATSAADATKKATCTIEVSETKKDAWTIMIYMCGSNLEYDGGDGDGYATADLEEILDTNLPVNPTAGEKINIVVQTGGIDTKGKWYLSSTYLDGATSISASKTQRWEVQGKKLHLVETNNTSTMSTQTEFTKFLNWGLDNYEANRYGVIMWDHGGGIGGCLNDKASGKYLTNSAIAQSCQSALSGRSFTKMDFIAYDCCLMGCADIASVNADYFKYMVGSQETEYAGGYDYDAWLGTLKSDPKGTSTDYVCDRIAQTFLQEQCYNYNNCRYCYQTNAVYDLSKMAQLIADFNTFSSSLGIDTQAKFNTMCEDVFEKALAFGADSDGSLYGLCDFADLIKKLGTKYSKSTTTLINDIAAVVVHNYYCVKYGSVKPCGMNGFVAHPYNNPEYPMQVSRNDYTGQYSTKFTNWQTMNLNFGEFY